MKLTKIPGSAHVASCPRNPSVADKMWSQHVCMRNISVLVQSKPFIYCTDLCCCVAEEDSCKILPVINMHMTFGQLFTCGFRYFFNRINKNSSLSDFDL